MVSSYDQYRVGLVNLEDLIKTFFNFLCWATVTVAPLVAPTQLVAQAKPLSTSSTSYLRSSDWIIGPIVFGENQSRGVALHPFPAGRRGWYINLPQAPGSVHYVTFRHGSLAGKTLITMRYRLETDPGVRIEPVTAPGSASIITLYFQRAGDDWSGVDQFETYRWYATFASQSPLTAGEHVMTASLRANWTAVQTSSARSNPLAFHNALDAADQLGFVLGGGTGYGHGVFATGRARLIVEDFRVE
ncbi:MAG: hypothetical protein NVS3B5_04750 [Sphingomicrobium sp.]